MPSFNAASIREKMPTWWGNVAADGTLIVTGTVTDVQPQHRHFSVKTGPFPSQSFWTNEQTQIVDKRKTDDLSRLSIGNQVSVRYIRGNSKHIARMVKILIPAGQFA